MEGLTLGLGIIRLELMTSTMSRWHSTAELYPFPTLIWKENWLMNNNLPKGRETQHNYPTILSRTTWSQTFLLFTLLRKKIGAYSEWILSKVVFPTDSNHNIWSRKISNILPILIKQVLHELESACLIRSSTSAYGKHSILFGRTRRTRSSQDYTEMIRIKLFFLHQGEDPMQPLTTL